MRRYSVQPRDQIFVNSYGFLSYAKNIGKNIGTNISKSLIITYNHAIRSITDALETSSKQDIQKSS